ncbi:MAG: tetratricopeptide repeat protein, partial [Bacteroidales bacterium]|nr:tetratricopeptide repeat protein [Bacteroidales bacterium]
EKAQPLFRQLDDTLGLIDCQHYNMSAWQLKEEYDKAIDECKKLINSTFVIQNEGLYYRMMQNLAIMYGTIDHYQSAITIYQEVLQYFQSKNDTLNIITSCNNIMLLLSLTDYVSGVEESIQLFDLAYPLTIASHDSLHQAQLLSKISNVYIEQGDFKKAKESMMHSLSIREALQDKESLSYGFQDMANIYILEKDYDGAMDYLYRSLQIASETDNHLMTCYDFELMGKIFQMKNNHQQAINYFQQAIEIAEEYHFGQQQLDCIQARILSLSALGKIDEANDDFKKYLEMYDFLKTSDQIEQSIMEENIHQKNEQDQIKNNAQKHIVSIIRTILLCIGLIVICWLFFSHCSPNRFSKKS